MEFRKERAKMLISRRNQLLLEFSFWNEPLPRPGPNIYELRTYDLKVSTHRRTLHVSSLFSYIVDAVVNKKISCVFPFNFDFGAHNIWK